MVMCNVQENHKRMYTGHEIDNAGLLELSKHYGQVVTLLKPLGLEYRLARLELTEKKQVVDMVIQARRKHGKMRKDEI